MREHHCRRRAEDAVRRRVVLHGRRREERLPRRRWHCCAVAILRREADGRDGAPEVVMQLGVPPRDVRVGEHSVEQREGSRRGPEVLWVLLPYDTRDTVPADVRELVPECGVVGLVSRARVTLLAPFAPHFIERTRVLLAGE